MDKTQAIENIIKQIFTKDKIRKDISESLQMNESFYKQMGIDSGRNRIQDNIWEIMLYDEKTEKEIKTTTINLSEDDINFISYTFILQEYAGTYYKIRVAIGNFFAPMPSIYRYQVEK